MKRKNGKIAREPQMARLWRDHGKVKLSLEETFKNK